MEIILLDIDPADSGKYDGHSGEVYLKLVLDTREVQLWIALVHLESGTSVTGCYPLSPYIGLLYVEKFSAIRMEPATLKKWLAQWPRERTLNQDTLYVQSEEHGSVPHKILYQTERPEGESSVPPHTGLSD